MTDNSATVTSDQTNNAANETTDGTISESQAEQIAEAALKSAFGSNFNQGLKEYSSQMTTVAIPPGLNPNDSRILKTNILEAIRNHTVVQRPEWNVYWSSKDFALPAKSPLPVPQPAVQGPLMIDETSINAQMIIYGASIDAKTGEVLTLRNESLAPGKRSKTRRLRMLKKLLWSSFRTKI